MPQLRNRKETDRFLQKERAKADHSAKLERISIACAKPREAGGNLARSRETLRGRRVKPNRGPVPTCSRLRAAERLFSQNRLFLLSFMTLVIPSFGLKYHDRRETRRKIQDIEASLPSLAYDDILGDRCLTPTPLMTPILLLLPPFPGKALASSLSNLFPLPVVRE